MAENHHLDQLDRSILKQLLISARTPYTELAKLFAVSPGTIHVRIEKMRQAGVILGTKIELDPKKLGYDVCCFIGIILKTARDYQQTIDKLLRLDEVLEAHYTTGHYSIFIKVMVHSIDELQLVLINKIQTINSIQSTETLISLQNPINRAIMP